MKRDNFERVQQIMKDIIDKEHLVKEIEEFLAVDGLPSVEARVGKQYLYISIQYRDLTHGYIHAVKHKVSKEIEILTAELETL